MSVRQAVFRGWVRRTHEKPPFEGCRAAPDTLQTAIIEFTLIHDGFTDAANLLNLQLFNL
jgi:hypothetical protein